MIIYALCLGFAFAAIVTGSVQALLLVCLSVILASIIYAFAP